MLVLDKRYSSKKRHSCQYDRATNYTKNNDALYCNYMNGANAGRNSCDSVTQYSHHSSFNHIHIVYIERLL